MKSVTPRLSYSISTQIVLILYSSYFVDVCKQMCMTVSYTRKNTTKMGLKLKSLFQNLKNFWFRKKSDSINTY